MRKMKLLIFSGIVLSLLATLYSPTTSSGDPDRVKCVFLMEEIRRYTFCTLQTGGRANGSTAEEEVVSALEKLNGTTGKSYFDIQTKEGKKKVLDVWGNPLNIRWKDECLEDSRFSAFKSSKWDIVIWSSGPNGINEYGAGDDVFRELVDPHIVRGD